MTQAVSSTPTPATVPVAPASPRFIAGLWYALTFMLAPRTCGRRWTRIPLWKAMCVACLNLLAVTPGVIQFALRTHRNIDMEGVPRPIGLVVMMLAGLAGFFVMLFFVVLPFAAQAGSTRACTRHVIRAILLSTTMIYYWVAVFMAAGWVRMHFRALHGQPSIEDVLYFAGVGGAMLLYTTWATARAAAVDYRSPEDLPGPREPHCDDCGYDLRATPHDSRCPECGKPVADSLGPTARNPSDWEQRPRYRRIGAIAAQALRLVVEPIALYRSIPLLTDLPAAKRWLALMIGLVGFLAFWISLGVRYVAVLSEFTTVVDFSMLRWPFFAIGLTFAGIWVFLALMMVGIETAGLVIASRFRGTSVDFGAAAKVTSYASTLLLFWVLTGGLQVVGILLYAAFDGPKRVGPRYDGLISVGSLFAAHIGGLLWFEMTVYRGLRAIQYANK